MPPRGADPEPVAVLGYKFWQRYYNGERDVVDKTTQLAHKTYTVVGVAQPRFTWNDGDVYLPIKVSAGPSKTIAIITKLKPGVTHAASHSSPNSPRRHRRTFHPRVSG